MICEVCGCEYKPDLRLKQYYDCDYCRGEEE